ncbi:hypothetical protein T190607A02C_160086 [Tenacibaculum sp. 190524A02b]
MFSLAYNEFYVKKIKAALHLPYFANLNIIKLQNLSLMYI